MSKKSKHHKPKGPKYPPQVSEQQEIPTSSEPQITEEKQEKIVELKSEPVAKVIEGKDVTEKEPQNTETKDAVQTPVKPKRHRNRRKKQHDGAQDEEKDDVEDEGVSCENVSQKESVTSKSAESDQPEIKPVEVTPIEANQQNQTENKNSSKNKKSNKNKGKDVEKTEAVAQTDISNKNQKKENKKDVAQAQVPVDKTKELKTEKKRTAEKDMSAPKVPEKRQEEEVGKEIDNKKESDNEKNIIHEESKTDESKVCEKPERNKKGKNKKNKDIADVEDKKEEFKIDEPKPEISDQVTEKDQKQSHNVSINIERQSHEETVQAPEVKGSNKNKDNKKKKNNVSKQEIKKTDILCVKEEEEGQIVKEETKCEKKISSCKKDSENKIFQPEQTEAEKDKICIDDDILPALATSIEENLQKLIICESDVILGEQLQAEEDKKKLLQKETIKSQNISKERTPSPSIQEMLFCDVLHKKPVEVKGIVQDSVKDTCTFAQKTIVKEKSQEKEKGKHEKHKGNKKTEGHGNVAKDTQKLSEDKQCLSSLTSTQQPKDELKMETKTNISDYKIEIQAEKPQGALEENKSKELILDNTKIKSTEVDVKTSPNEKLFSSIIGDKSSDKKKESIDSTDKKEQSSGVSDNIAKLESFIINNPISEDIIQTLLSDTPPSFLTQGENVEIGSFKENPIKQNEPEKIDKLQKIISDKPNLLLLSATKSSNQNVCFQQVSKENLDLKNESNITQNLCLLENLSLKAKDDEKHIPFIDENKHEILTETLLTEPAVTEKSEHAKHQKQKSKKNDKKKGECTSENIEQPCSEIKVIEDVTIISEQVKIEEKPVIKDIKVQEIKPKIEVKEVEKEKTEGLQIPDPLNQDTQTPVKRAKDKKNKQKQHLAQKTDQTIQLTTESGSHEDTKEFVCTIKMTKESECNIKTKCSEDVTLNKNEDKPVTDQCTKTNEADVSAESKEPQIIEEIKIQEIKTDDKSQNIAQQLCVAAQTTGEAFEFLKIPSVCPIQEGDTPKKTEEKGIDKSIRRSKSPNKQSKNWFGQSNTPVKSNKCDYKKEKNKDTQKENVSLDTGTVHDAGKTQEALTEKTCESPKCSKKEGIKKKADKKGKQKQEIKPEVAEQESSASLIENIEDLEEEFVYKYSFRTVFIANACHVCKAQLKDDRVVCRFCHLVSYCTESHRDDDWTSHQMLCYAICTLAHVKGMDHIYGDAKSLNGQDYRLLRMQAIVSCEKILKRKLCPWEQEVLLYPRICQEPSCREWKNANLKDCEHCGQVSYCRKESGHCPQNHSSWCQSYRLYHRLVAYQLHQGRIEPQLPSKIFPDGYQLSDASDHVFNELYDTTKEMDECHHATLTQLSTAPLTALYAYQKFTQPSSGIAEAGSKNIKKDSLCLHVIGAELQFEADTLNKWECFFLHLTGLQELNVVFVGPELNTSKLPVDLLSKIRMCASCRDSNRNVRFEFHDGMLYHDFVETEKFTKPDLVCAFNPGFHRATGYAGLDTWPETISSALRLKAPLCVTAYTQYEMPRDLARVKEVFPEVQTKIEPSKNPYSSLRPDRNFISDDEMPLIFKNYQLMVLFAN